MTHRQTHLLVWILALLPAVVVLVLLRPAAPAGPAALLNFLGRLTGIAGLALMLAAAILSCRVPGFDRPFGGLTKLWRTHHQLAAVAFLLLLAHPLLLALAAAEVNLQAAAATLLPRAGDWAGWAGWGALLLLMLFLAPSFKFLGEPDYQRWKHLHRLAAPAVVLAIGHTLYLARTLPAHWDAALWFTLAALAVLSIGYRFIYARLWGRHRFRVAAVEHPANNVVELSLTTDGPPLVHDPGQFVYLTPFDPELTAGKGEEHPYTLSSAPGEPALRIAIKDLGDASRAIAEVHPGSEVAVEGPYGAFFPRTMPGGPELWIAGGIGITPFLGRARHLAASGTGIDVVLIFCIQDEARALFADELRRLAERIHGLRLELHYFYQHGPLDAAFVLGCCPDTESRTLHACGPAPLLELVGRIARGAGIPRSRVITEEFNLL